MVRFEQQIERTLTMDGGDMAQPGPIYDNALRLLAAVDLKELCRWIGVPAAQGTVRSAESLPAHTMHADLVVTTGPGRLAQVEFVTHVTTDLRRRMVTYRARLMDQHPGSSLRQHIVVLGTGRVRPVITDADQFWMRLHITYARKQNPTELLKTPSLAPLAVLGRSSHDRHRAAVLRSALGAIRTDTDSDRREKLAQTAATLAAIRLDADTIATIWKETGMPISLGDTDLGRHLLQEGLHKGRQEGATRWAALLVRRRFGDDARIPEVAASLARYPEERVLEAVEAAVSLDALFAASERGLDG